MQIRRLVAAASRGGGGEGRRHSSEQASALLLLAFIEFSESRAHTGREQTRYFPRLGQADRPIRKAFQLVGPFARSRSRNNFHSRIALSASLSFIQTGKLLDIVRAIRFIVDAIIVHFLCISYSRKVFGER